MKKYKTVILQSCDEPFAKHFQSALKANAAYANANGYGYQQVIGNLSPVPNTSNFNRYYLLQQQIDKQTYDWAFWIDGDAAIIDRTILLESIIDRSPDKLLIACRGSMNGDHDINNGVFFLNLRHTLARSLTTRCIEHCEGLSESVNPNDSGFQDDQHVMHDWLHSHRNESGRVPIVQCYTGDEANLFNYDGPFVRHLLREFGSLQSRGEQLSLLIDCEKVEPQNTPLSFQEQHGIHVVAPAAFAELPPQSWALLESCKRYGIDLALLGQQRPYPNHLYKIELVAEYLTQHPECRYVLQVDLVDVVFCATLWEMFVKYKSFGHDIVAAAERVHWPVPSHEHLSPETGTSCRYLNAGAVFSTREAWLAAWKRIQEKGKNTLCSPSQLSSQEITFLRTDDQAAWSNLYITGEADIAIDSTSTLFQTLNQTDWSIAAANRDFVFEGRRIMNRETSERPCLIHANAKIPVEPWANYVLNPSTVWMWPLIERIRHAPLSQLRDVEGVESLLLTLGLHDPVEGMLRESQLCFSGKGLSIWQRTFEFASYLVWLSRRPAIDSYLEIGVESGGSFITTIEYLRRFHPLSIAVGVDPWFSEPVRAYVSRTLGAHFVQGTQESPELRSLVDTIGMVDLTLIDGDHSHHAVRQDWEFARTRSRDVAFHDIAGDNLPGVKSLWTQIREENPHNTYEFVDDYWVPNQWAGLGVVEVA